jgi:uncharacterized protein (DUF885 family)
MTKKTLPLLSIFLLVFISCTSKPKNVPALPAFNEQVSLFFKQYWDLFPESALRYGKIDKAAELTVASEESRQQRVSFFKKQIQLFSTFEDEDLSFSQRIDKALLLNKARYYIWQVNEYKSHEWNPSLYNVGSDFNRVLLSQKLKESEKVEILKEKLLKVPAYYKQAQENIKKPTKVHTRHAIEQSEGLVKFFRKDMKKQVRKMKLKRREKNALYQRIEAAAAAVNSYKVFLRRVLKKPEDYGGFSDFRIGKELYKKKFAYDLQSQYSPEELYQKAIDAKHWAGVRLFEEALILYPKFFGIELPPKDRQKVIRKVMAKVVKDHVKPKEFVDAVRKQIPDLVKFVKEKQLLTLDAKPLTVRETPPFQRGFAIASIQAPGPFDPSAETYYNVTPLDNKVSRKKKRSFLREYNNYTMQILNIHEAIPGHYVQLNSSNKSPSLVKTVFGSSLTIEGWAVYAERMMLEQGYAADSPEVKFMYYKWFLRVVTNAIIDYEIHNKNLDKKTALKYMMEDAFQEKAEAEGKWKRAQLSQVQLCSYFTGFNEILELREEVKKEDPEEYKLKNFHDKFLSFGNAPVREIKKLML